MNKIENFVGKLEKSCIKWTGYFDVYDRFFNKFIGKSPKILEIGVFGGGSIELWLKYFGENTEVIGIDIDQRCSTYKYEGNAKIIIGDQGDPNFWNNFFAENNNFDIIIDDGSHIFEHQILTLQKSFPHLKDGGVYVCEDTHTSYCGNSWSYPGLPIYWPKNDKKNNFIDYARYLVDVVTQQNISDYPDELKCLFQQDMDPYILEMYKNLYSVSFFNSMVILEKEKLKPFFIQDFIRKEPFILKS